MTIQNTTQQTRWYHILDKKTLPIHQEQYSNRIGGVMVGVLASSDVDHEFQPRSGQTKYYKIGICCFSAKHGALRRKSKGG